MILFWVMNVCVSISCSVVVLKQQRDASINVLKITCKFVAKKKLILLFLLLTFTTHFRVLASSCLRFRYHTQGRTTVGRASLYEWSARRRDFYLTHNTHNRQISMPPVGFEPAIPASERLQIHASHRSATGIGCKKTTVPNFIDIR